MEPQTQPTATTPQTLVDEISLMDMLLVISKHNRMIIKFTGTVAVLSVIVALLLPNIYTGKTVILPPKQSGSSAGMMMGALGGGMGGVSSGMSGMLGMKNASDLYVGILKSDTVADSLIKRFKLQALYDQDTLVETRTKLGNATSILSGKDGFITVEFSDADPLLAANITNAYTEELDHLNQTLAITEAAQRRAFFEQQLKKVKEDQIAAEMAFKEVQERTGLIQLDAQGEVIIKAAAELRAQIAVKEVELAAMRAYATAQNPDYRQVLEVIDGLKVQLTKVEHNNLISKGSVLLPASKVPEMGLEYIRRMREVKYQEVLLELLSKQFEIAKIDEAKQSVIVQVMDKATPPEKKSKPKRALIVMLSTIVALFLAILWAFFKDMAARANEDTEQAGRIQLLRRHIRQGR